MVVKIYYLGSYMEIKVIVIWCLCEWQVIIIRKFRLVASQKQPLRSPIIHLEYPPDTFIAPCSNLVWLCSNLTKLDLPFHDPKQPQSPPHLGNSGLMPWQPSWVPRRCWYDPIGCIFQLNFHLNLQPIISFNFYNT